MTPAGRHLPCWLLVLVTSQGLVPGGAVAQSALPTASPRSAPSSAGGSLREHPARVAAPPAQPHSAPGTTRNTRVAITIPTTPGPAARVMPTTGSEPFAPTGASADPAATGAIPTGNPPAGNPPAERQAIKLRPPEGRADGQPDRPVTGPPRPRAGSSLGSLLTMSSSLAMVLGLFFVAAWLFRKQGAGGLGNLPKEVVEVLGRTNLPGRQHLQLIRCGSKLLLVSVTAGGAETLTEICDPAEVERLAGLCRRGRADSSTASFRQVLDDWGRQPHAGGFLDREPAESPAPARPRSAREVSRA